MIYLQMFWEFFKIGLFAVGGGLATIPFLYDLAEVYPWFSAADLTNMIAISESTPGPIGINMATFVGYTVGSAQGSPFLGILCAIITTLALVLPSIIIILVIAHFLTKFDQNPLVRATFMGLRPAVAALIGAAAYEIISITLINIPRFTAAQSFWLLFEPISIAIFAVVLFCMIKFKKVAPQWYLLVGATLGIVLQL